MDNWTKAGIVIVLLIAALILYGVATDCPETAGYVRCKEKGPEGPSLIF